MEVDTRASISLLNFNTCNDVKAEENELLPTLSRLRTYTGEIVKPGGESEINFHASLLHNFIITDESSPNVLGRDVFKNLRLNWENNFCVFVCKTSDKDLNRLLFQYTDAFKSGIGTFEMLT